MLSEFFNNITSFFVNIFSLFEGKRNIRILMIGLDGAGKNQFNSFDIRKNNNLINNNNSFFN